MEFFAKAAELKQANQPFVIVTVTKVEGSVPGKLGYTFFSESAS